MTDLSDTWDRIHRWLAAHAPAVLASLAPPATDDQFHQVESVTGAELPEGVKACYRVHNGQAPFHRAPPLLSGHRWHGLGDMADYWETLHSLRGEFAEARGAPRGPIRKDWWHRKWLPLTRDGAGDLHCLDLFPPKRGHVGQVIYWYHDEGERFVVANSLPEWLALFAAELERGAFTTAPDTHGPGLVRVRDL
ncbi:SMI1/KNR4 family protein [Gemmata sp. JC673]|uniref:SMI1/KNR4 family protein n=1 Tax=Gemmata algarum TaxID=2975278 RepID=A0ABU5F321_9BACT|nr:SMI1/KNR4 family protein [Gemmata algarum]MDY3561740.1 SMI1/KNR4 family protein [Gemmata algarum]